MIARIRRNTPTEANPGGRGRSSVQAANRNQQAINRSAPTSRVIRGKSSTKNVAPISVAQTMA
jgi:hypothetical protein